MAAQVWNNRTSGWISVNDRLPTMEKRDDLQHLSVDVIITDGKKVDSGFYDFDEQKWYWKWMPVKVTHWMPLPEPPEEETS